MLSRRLSDVITLTKKTLSVLTHYKELDQVTKYRPKGKKKNRKTVVNALPNVTTPANVEVLLPLLLMLPTTAFLLGSAPASDRIFS